MRSRWLWIPACVLLAAGLLLIFFRADHPTPGGASPNVRPVGSDTSGTPANVPERSELADGLNAPDGTIERDLEIVDSVLEAFRLNFPGGGNPVGENNEITAALAGRNRLSLQLLPKGHPAINLRGELVDRWSTPFFFHQVSGQMMEIRSAGPDKRLYTEDDTVLTPGG